MTCSKLKIGGHIYSTIEYLCLNALKRGTTTFDMLLRGQV